MDTHKISFSRLKNFLAIIWVIILIIAFFGFSQKFSLGQLTKNIFLKKQNLPLLVMAQGENKSLGEIGFSGGRQISNNQNDYIFIGPYWPLLPGNYKVVWQILSDCEGHLGWADVVSRLEGSEYGKVEIRATRPNEVETINLPFQGDFSWNYEFRMIGQNQCEFKVVKGELIRENLDWKSLLKQMFGKIK